MVIYTYNQPHNFVETRIWVLPNGNSKEIHLPREK